MRIVKLESQRSWIDELSDDTRNALLSVTRVDSYDEGELIFRRGEQLSGIYTVKSGCVEMRRSLFPNEQLIVGLVRPRGSLGLIGTFSKHGAVNTAIAREPSLIKVLPKNNLIQIGREYPELFPKLFDEIGDLFALAMGWIDFSFSATAKTKLLWSLKHLTRFAPTNTNGIVTLDLSQQELADSLGLSRQATNRELKRLEAKQIVEIEYGKLFVNQTKIRELEPENL